MKDKLMAAMDSHKSYGSKRSKFKIRRIMAAVLKLTHQKLLECISGSAINFKRTL